MGVGSLKNNSNTSPALYGVQVSSSLYNTAIQMVYGMRRVPLQLINSWDFHNTGSSGKKGKSGKKGGGGPPTYAASMDYLLTFGPVWNMWGAWRNGNITGYLPDGANGLFTQTFSVSSGSWSEVFNGWTASVTVGTSIDGIFAVSNTWSQTAVLEQYGGPTGTFVGEVEQWLYNTYFSAGNPDTYAWRPGSWWLGQPFCNSGSCTFGIGADRGSTSVTATMPASWTPVDSTITVYYGKSTQAVPYSQLGYQFETQLGEDAAGGGANPPLVYPDFSGLYAPNQDLGSSGTTPNDNFEIVGAFSLTAEGTCNPADIILDIILSGNIFFPPSDISASFTPIAYSHGLDFSNDPTRTNVIDGSVFPYPPVLTFPYVVPGNGVISILKDPPVFVQEWSSTPVYPVGAIVQST